MIIIFTLPTCVRAPELRFTTEKVTSNIKRNKQTFILHVPGLAIRVYDFNNVCRRNQDTRKNPGVGQRLKKYRHK